jgi:hypothetical protein
MKKNLFFFAMLASVAASATVTVTPISADYAGKKVTFKVAWTNTPGAPYNNRVWLWIDFCPVTGTTPANSFSTATVSSPAVTAGNGTITGATARGFFIAYSAANAGTTVTATLGNAPAGKFNWCAYASDCPPTATMADGTYTLKGSPPFNITYNGSSYTETASKTFTLGCMNAITDATGCPGIINYSFSAGALGNGSWGSMGEFLNTGGTPLPVVSATAAAGSAGIRYKWYKNNAVIGGATAATYLPPKADAAAAGTFNYTRKACDGVCNTTETAASGTWTNVVGGPIHTYAGCSIYVAMYDITAERTWSEANAACSSLGSGWRLPVSEDVRECLIPHAEDINLNRPPVTPSEYWTGVMNAATAYMPFRCEDGVDMYAKFGVCDCRWPGWGGNNAGYGPGEWGFCDPETGVVRCVKNK